MAKKIDETTTAASSAAGGFGAKKTRAAPGPGIGAPFNKKVKKEVLVKTMTVSRDSTRVFKPKNGHTNGIAKRGGHKKGEKQEYTDARLESKSERSLREAIRNLVFLNRIKYHEEQALNEMQEQKVRKIIRHLLSEAEQTYNTTGQQKAAQFYEKIAVTFKDYAALVSVQKQRDEFKKMYLTGIKLALDGLDQQYKLVNPETQTAPAVAPQQNQQAALAEAEGASGPAEIGAPAPVNPLKNVDTKPVFQQAIAGAVSAAGIKDPTGHGGADSALVRDLPQLAVVGYNDLTFEQFEATNADGKSRSTNDRRDFRIILLGDMEKQTTPGQQGELGRIAEEFARIDQMNPTNDMKNKGNENIPATSRAEEPSGAAVDTTAPTIEPNDLGAELPNEEDTEPV